MEKPSCRVIITGKDADATAELLRQRLCALDNAPTAVLLVETAPAAEEAEGVAVFALGTHDTPDFAAEKILDSLDERGWISLDAGALGPEEEEQIRARLQGLGYLE